MFRNVFVASAVILATAVLHPETNADIVFGENNGAVTIEVINPIDFDITSNGDIITRFIFEDAYSSAPGAQFGGFQSNTIGALVNGSTSLGGGGSTWGPLAFNLGEWDTDDFGIGFTVTGGLINSGDTVTLTPGIATTNVPASFLPDLLPSSVIMTTNNGSAISNRVTISKIPEPGSTICMAVIGTIGVVRRRR